MCCRQAIFRQEFMGEFLTVLLAGLSEGGARALVREEALAALHAMAAVDFVAFRRAFLPHFLHSQEGLAPQLVEQLADFPPDMVRKKKEISVVYVYLTLSPCGEHAFAGRSCTKN